MHWESRTMHWDFTPLQRYPHDYKLKRSTPQPHHVWKESHHALRFHVSLRAPTWLQVEEEHTTIAPCIENQSHHSFEERFNTHLHVKEIHSHDCTLFSGVLSHTVSVAAAPCATPAHLRQSSSCNINFFVVSVLSCSTPHPFFSTLPPRKELFSTKHGNWWPFSCSSPYQSHTFGLLW